MTTEPMTKVTAYDLDYKVVPYGRIAIIPKGTPVRLATNPPSSQIKDRVQYWAEAWDGMDEIAESWQMNYGFLIDWDQVTSA